MNTDAPTRRGEVRKWHSNLVLISCCLIMILHIGFIYSIGSIFTDVMATFNKTRAETAVLQSTTLAVCLCSGLFIGALINKIGLMMVGMLGSLAVSLALIACFFASSLTFLIISIEVFSGFGCSCVYISSAAAISQNFSDKKQALYLSIHAAGSGIGGMIYPYLIRFLSDLYGLRGALLIIGAIVMNTVPGCILWKQHSQTNTRQERESKIAEFETRFQVRTDDSGDSIVIEKLKQASSTIVSDSVYVSQYPVLQSAKQTKIVTVLSGWKKSSSSNKSSSDQTLNENIRQVLHNKIFMIFVLGMIISIPSLNLIIIFVADIYLDNGLTNDDVSLGLLLINVMSIVGRLLPGISLHSKYIAPLALPIFNTVVSAVITFIFTFIDSRWSIFVLCGAFGIPIGMCVSLCTVLTLELVGSKNLPIAVGIYCTLDGIAQLISGPVNGYIRDVSGSYTPIFYTSAAINVAGAAIHFVAYIIRRKEKQKSLRRSSVFYLTSF